MKAQIHLTLSFALCLGHGSIRCAAGRQALTANTSSHARHVSESLRRLKSKKVFYGEIGDSRVRVELRREGRELRGEVLYLYTDESLDLKGAVNNRGDFVLAETVGAERASTWKGTWTRLAETDQSKLIGTYESANSKSAEPFSLLERQADYAGGVRIIAASKTQNKSGYSIMTEYPRLKLGNAALSLRINAEVSKHVRRLVGDYWKYHTNRDQKGRLSVDDRGMFEVYYEVTLVDRRVASLRFDSIISSTSLAHPVQQTSSINFDLVKGRRLELADLFMTRASYRKLLGLCAKSLNGTKAGLGSDRFSGKDMENYSSWNLTADGISLIFDAYTITSYGEGEQQVNISYGNIKDLLKADAIVSSLTK